MKSTPPPLPPSPEGEANLFVAALRLPELERTAFLDGACHGNTTLRLRLQALLAAHAQPDPNLALAGDDAPLGIGPSPSAELADDAVGQTLGRYKLLEKLGEGGCGVVYVAEQTQPVRRRVALKVIKPGMDTRQVVARFEAERQALAMMDHPNIAKILDAGITDDRSEVRDQRSDTAPDFRLPTADFRPPTSGSGRPYFVMELVHGSRITDYCEQANLSTKERLNLFIMACQAIQHAHQKGIIHRDIKPSNILVARHDGVPVPKVIDFGIAKATEGTLTDATVYTQLHHFIGTPAYMSPEQAEMSGLDIDTRSDIYSLGVLLYELLTGSTPFDAKELMASGLDAMRKTIREKEPVRPSTKLTQALAKSETRNSKSEPNPKPEIRDPKSDIGPALAPGQRRRRRAPSAFEPRASDLLRVSDFDLRISESADSRRRLRLKEQIARVKGDLDWIVMKCLEKERGRRYATANGLAADLRRHLNNEPVIARPPSAGYRFYKAWQRHKLAFVAGGSVAVALLSGIVATSWQALEANRARIGEKAQRLRADAENADARRLLYRANMNLAQQAWEQNDFGHLQQLLKEAEQSADRGFEWYYWQRQAHLPVKTLRGHLDGLTSAAFSPDGARIVTGGEDRIAQVWDAASGRKLAMFRAYPAPIYSATFSPDGQWVANGGEAPHAVLWDAANGRQVRTFQGHSARVWSVAFSADGQRIVGGCEDGTGKVWNTATGEQLLTLQGHTNRIFSVAFSPDGRLIVTGSLDRTARVWDPATGRELVKFAGHNDVIWGVAFSPDSQRIVTGSDDRLAKVWEVSSGRELLVLRGHGAGVGPVAFSPDGRRIATGSADRTVKIWEATTGQELATLKGHTWWLTSVAFSPDSQFIVSASQDKTAKVWGAAAQSAPLALEGHPVWGRAGVAFSPDGQKIITVSQEVTATVWEVTTGHQLLTLRLPPDGFLSVAFSPDGRRILTGSGGVDNPAKVWDAASGRELLAFKGHKAGVLSVAFSPDGRQILTGSLDNSAKLWDAANGRELLSLTGHTKEIQSVAFSHNGHRIATVSRDKTAKVWDAVTGQQVLTFRGHSAAITSIAFSPDDLRIVTGSDDQTAKVWEPTTGRELATLAGHSVSVTSVAFSPDGRRIATGGVDGLAKVWAVRPDLARAQVPLELLSLKGHMAGISAAAFSPDGQSIATAGGDQTVKVWEAASPQQVAAWRNEEITDAQYLESLEKQRNGGGR